MPEDRYEEWAEERREELRRTLGQYERLREALSRELGASPEAATRRLREDIATGRFPEAQLPGPPLEEASDLDKHDLPVTRTSFVGREREMVEIKRSP